MPARGTSAKSDERRRDVLEAAVTCFSRKGFYGTATQEIADLAGISQPYVYRLFANKQELFAGAVHQVSALMQSTIASHAHADHEDPEIALQAAREAYGALIQDRTVMMFLMHANCAADEPIVGDAVRDCYAKQVEMVSDLYGFDAESTRRWFGAGMLDNVVRALRLREIDEPWARTMSSR